MSSAALPGAVQAGDLTAALRQAGVLGAGEVRAVVVESTRDMVLSRIRRLRVTYDRGGDAPATFILKTELPARAGQGGDGPRREVEFYTRIAPATAAQVAPRCFGADRDPATGAWHTLLEDLDATHRVATQWPLPPSMAQCEAIMQARARFHAAWWDAAALGVTVGEPPVAASRDRHIERLARNFAQFMDRMGDGLPAERVRLCERLLAAAPRLLAAASTRANRTIIHGDAHVWNCFLPRDPASADVRLFDWDSWRIAAGATDLAYMMAMHWYPDLRRAREARLLDRYHEALVAAGITGYDRQALDADYRLAVLWHVMLPIGQAAYGIPPMIWWNNFHRILLAVDDLGCRDLLD